MARATKRRMLTVECLEQREVLSAGGPTQAAQYLLETINDFRTNPGYAAQWVQNHLDPLIQSNIQAYNVDLPAVLNAITSTTPKQPLAFNAQLTDAAQGQSQDMAQNGYQSHTNSKGQDLNARLNQVGYNGATRSTEDAFAYAQSPDNALQSFLIDWGVPDAGHRKGLFDVGVSAPNSASEVGIGVATSTKVGPQVVTIDFAHRPSSSVDLVGTVYDDSAGTGHFALGSGIGNATIRVTNQQTGAVQTTQTWDAGGYQLALSPGSYAATATVNGQNLGTHTFTINDQNVHIDFRLQDAQPAVVAAPAAAAAPRQATVTTTPVVPKAAVMTAPTPTTTTSSVNSQAPSSGLLDDWDPSATPINWYSSWSGAH